MSEGLLQFLQTVGDLKRTDRAGWVLRGVSNPESVSDHMYRMAIMAMTCADPESQLNIDRCVKICLVHDMAECIVGDITPADNIPQAEKHKKEQDAMDHLCGLLDEKKGLDIKSLYEEYETQSTAEAIFVKDLDKFDMILQAYQYEKEKKEPGWLQEFFNSVEGKIRTPSIQKLVDNLHKIRNQDANT